MSSFGQGFIGIIVIIAAAIVVSLILDEIWGGEG